MAKSTNWIKGLALFTLMVALIGSLAAAPGASAASFRQNSVPLSDLGKISVVAVDPTGASDGIAGATVVVRQYNSDVIVLKGLTDQNGAFASYIAQGLYRVEVIADGFKPFAQDVKVAPRQNTSVVANLEASDPALAPVPSATDY